MVEIGNKFKVFEYKFICKIVMLDIFNVIHTS